MNARSHASQASFANPLTEHDTLREERIENLSSLARQALMAGETSEFRRLDKELKAAALARSTEAIRYLAKARAVASGGAE